MPGPVAKLPVNIDQTAKSKSNAQDKGGTNEDSSRRGAKGDQGPPGPTGAKSDQGPAGPAGSAGSAGLRIVSGVKTVNCSDDEVLVSLLCSAGVPDGAECSAGVTATGLCMRK